MENIRSIVTRFPERELDIRRRCARDAHFRFICTDYEEAATALRYWESVAKEGDRKVEEYANLLSELEVEILGQLDRRSISVDTSDFR